MTEVRIEPHFDAWRDAARHLLLQHRPPGRVLWVEQSAAATQPLLPGLAKTAHTPDAAVLRVAKRGGVRVPRSFLDIARRVACHRDPNRWTLLYRVLWRLVTSEPDLLADAADPDIRQLTLLDGHVRRDVHKMHAFVRFRKLPPDPDGSSGGDGTGVAGGRERFIAWYEPDHRILRLAAPFFAERFASLNWAILTPHESACFDGTDVRFGPPPQRPPRDLADDLEQLWCTYYAAVFNPARVKTAAMTRQMPRRFWKNLPETAQIDTLLAAPAALATAPTTTAAASPQPASAQPFIPTGPRLTLPQLRDALPACRGCTLCTNGTAPVPGEGPPDARIMLVGEQPGDTEADAGRPFIGPAGQVLDRALADAGLRRQHLYLTNAVKHFHFEPRGHRRIHVRPSAREVHACRPWLEAERTLLRPRVVVALGTTAAHAMLGPQLHLPSLRGQLLGDTEWAYAWLATHHPSSILRAQDPARQAQLYDELVAHLRLAADAAARPD